MRVNELIDLLKSVENTNMEVCFADTNDTVHDIKQVELANLSEDSGVGILLTTYK